MAEEPHPDPLKFQQVEAFLENRPSPSRNCRGRRPFFVLVVKSWGMRALWETGDSRDTETKSFIHRIEVECRGDDGELHTT